ncbi:hypothetical protein AALB16_11240 [Lachnospiraceae bacterium 62-35]
MATRLVLESSILDIVLTGKTTVWATYIEKMEEEVKNYERKDSGSD